jgi:carbonic anhydrase/acetyltransferase-like protein (isoleucine patch superfamily)
MTVHEAAAGHLPPLSYAMKAKPRCAIGDGLQIGANVVTMKRANLGRHCLIAPGAVITEEMKFGDKSLIAGPPAKATRTLSGAEAAGLVQEAREQAATANR